MKLVLLALLVACGGKKEAPKPKPPSQAVLDHVRAYCEAGELPVEASQAALQKLQASSNAEVTALMNRMMGGDKAAGATLHAAIVATTGVEKCSQLMWMMTNAKAYVAPVGSAASAKPPVAIDIVPSPIEDLPDLPPPSKTVPSKPVVDAMKTFCALGGKSPPETKASMATWLASQADNMELAELYNAALGNGDLEAIAKLRAAANAAVGIENCDFLDFLLKMSMRHRMGSGQ